MIEYIEKGYGMHLALEAANAGISLVNLEWVSGNESVSQEIIYAYPLSSTKSEVKVKIDEYAYELRNKVVRGISPAEMASWPIKRSEAALYATTSNQSDAPILAAEAYARGVPLSELVDRVASNSTTLSQIEAAIAGAAGKHRDAVDQLDSFESVLSYDWGAGWPSL